MQEHIPMGYRIVEGKAVPDLTAASIVKQIYKEYAAGISTNRIAKWLMQRGVENANGMCSWNHGSIGRILDNQRYLGDELFPPLVKRELFEQVQNRRSEQRQKLGKTMQLNRADNQSVFADKIVCGTCGTDYRRYIEHTRNPDKRILWRCKRAMRHHKGDCKSPHVEDWQIAEAFIEVVNQMISGNVSWKKKKNTKEGYMPYKVRLLTEQMQELEETDGYKADQMVSMIYERAKEQYQASEINDSWYWEERIEQQLIGRTPQQTIDEQLFTIIVREIIVQADGRLTLRFTNGYERMVYLDTEKGR